MLKRVKARRQAAILDVIQRVPVRPQEQPLPRLRAAAFSVPQAPRFFFACSGSADSLAAIPRLASAFNAEVVALTLDVGQAGELEGIRQAALAAGAVRAHVLDARDEFARCCLAASLDGAPAAYS